MTRHTVRPGDTLAGIAERYYGDGRFWFVLADANPAVRAVPLYHGQAVDVPDLPADPTARAVAAPLGHLPVRVRFDRTMSLFRHDSFGVFSVAGYEGEVTFHRHGPAHLGELTPSRLTAYRQEQIAWAADLFVRHLCRPPGGGPACSVSYLMPCPCDVTCPEYTVRGRLTFWETARVHEKLTRERAHITLKLVADPLALFESAVLPLADAAPPGNGLPEPLVPLARVLRAAGPGALPTAALWGVTRDPSALRDSRPAPAVGEVAPEPPPTPPARKPRTRAAAKKPPAPRKKRTSSAS